MHTPLPGIRFTVHNTHIRIHALHLLLLPSSLGQCGNSGDRWEQIYAGIDLIILYLSTSHNCMLNFGS